MNHYRNKMFAKGDFAGLLFMTAALLAAMLIRHVLYFPGC